MKITNKSGLPAGLVRAIQLDPYSNEGSDITASTLADPPLLQALKRKYDAELEEDASERMWALLGQAMHVVMERGARAHNKGADKLETAINVIADTVEDAEDLIASGDLPAILAEKRFSMDVLGWKLSGALDHYAIENGLLSDYKMTSVWTVIYGDRFKDYEKQLNVLAHLLEHHGHKVTGLEVIAVLRDWGARDLGRVKDYPPSNVQTIPLKLWPAEKRQEYIEERVRLHQAARELAALDREAEIVPCTDDERWAKIDKKGVKTYVRCGTPEKRGYCSAASVCPVLRGEQHDRGLQDSRFRPLGTDIE